MVNKNVSSDKADNYKAYCIVKHEQGVWQKIVDEGGYELYRLSNAYRKPLVTMGVSGQEYEVKMRDRGNWFVLFDLDPPLPNKFYVTFRTASNKHWRLIIVPENCRWSAPVCALRALISKPDDYSVNKDASFSDHVNRWNVETHALSNMGMGKTAIIKNPVLMIVFIPQLLMFLFIGVSIIISLVCLCLAVVRGLRDGH